MDTLLTEEKDKKLEESPLSPSLSTARKHLGLNVFSNVAYQVVFAAVTLWMTPFLIEYIGIAAYGMIPLANTLISYMSVFTTALNITMSRFLGIDLGEGKVNAANKTFNTALFSILAVVVALIPLTIALSLYFPYLFKVPPGWERDASILFAMIAATFFITIVAGIFSLSPFIYSQFLLTNLVNFTGLFARVSIVIILFAIFQPHLWYAGVGVLLSAIVCLLGYTILWHRFTPQLSIDITFFDRSRLRPLMGMGGWSLVNSVGGMLLDRVDLIVVNAYFGAILTGAYAVVVQFSVLLEVLAGTAFTVLRPVTLLKFAQGDFLGLRDVSSQSVKLFGIALALPVGLMCGFSRPLLSIWLGPSFAYLSLLLIIVVSHLSLNLSARPLLYVQYAYNKVRWPGIVTLVCGIASVLADLFVVHYGKWGYLGIAASTAMIWTFKNAVYIPIYTSHIMRQPWWSFLPSLKWSVIGTLFTGLTAYVLTLVYMPSNWFTLAISASLISLMYLGIVWAIWLNQNDKQIIISLSPLNRIVSA